MDAAPGFCTACSEQTAAGRITDELGDDLRLREYREGSFGRIPDHGAPPPRKRRNMTRLANALVAPIGTLTVELSGRHEKLSPPGREPEGHNRSSRRLRRRCVGGLRDQKSFELLDEAEDQHPARQWLGDRPVSRGEQSADKGVDANAVARRTEEAGRAPWAQPQVHRRHHRQGRYRYGREAGLSRAERARADVARPSAPVMHATSVIGAFAAVEKDQAKAAAAALCCFEIAAELAAARAPAPARFKEHLFDCAFALTEEQVPVDAEDRRVLRGLGGHSHTEKEGAQWAKAVTIMPCRHAEGARRSRACILWDIKDARRSGPWRAGYCREGA